MQWWGTKEWMLGVAAGSQGLFTLSGNIAVHMIFFVETQMCPLRVRTGAVCLPSARRECIYKDLRGTARHRRWRAGNNMSNFINGRERL